MRGIGRARLKCLKCLNHLLDLIPCEKFSRAKVFNAKHH